jgi:hypothetical protein
MFSILKYVSSWRRLAHALVIAGAAALAGCGGGGSGSPDVSVPATPAALAVGYGAKAFNFTWTASAEATSYQLLEDIDGAAGPGDFVQVGTTTTANITFVSPGLLHTRLNARYVVQACSSAGCSANSSPVQVDVNKAIGYFKASNTGLSDRFGQAIALSADGNTLAVGALQEGSKATGVNGDSADDSAADSGAVYVFVRVAGAWTQQAYLKASNTESQDFFGMTVALSGDGNTLSVGAPLEDSASTGVNSGGQGDNLAMDAGAVYVFTRTGVTWGQQAYIKPSSVAAFNTFGAAIALSADGNTLAAGAPAENSAGAAYIFTRIGQAWTQQARLSAFNADAGDFFGGAVALSADGTTLAVGAAGEASSAKTINGSGAADNSATSAGAAYVFVRTGAIWKQEAYVKAPNTDAVDLFGGALALSGDGNTLAVGALGEASSDKGVNGIGADNTLFRAGAVYVFSRTGTTWTSQAYLKASNTDAMDQFGVSVALSADGNTLAVGAYGEASSASGLVGGDPTNNATAFAGAAYVFKRAGTAWTQQAYVKASNTSNDLFGLRLALSGDGNTLAVGAGGEASNATGVNGNQSDNSVSQAGAVYLY